MFRGARQVFQVGQAPSGPTVIRPLMFGDLEWPLNASRGFASISWASCHFIWGHCAPVVFTLSLHVLWKTSASVYEFVDSHEKWWFCIRCLSGQTNSQCRCRKQVVGGGLTEHQQAGVVRSSRRDEQHLRREITAILSLAASSDAYECELRATCNWLRGLTRFSSDAAHDSNHAPALVWWPLFMPIFAWFTLPHNSQAS